MAASVHRLRAVRGHEQVVRAVDRYGTPGGEWFDPADMIVVMMGDENGRQFEFFLAKIGEHRRSIARIDHDGVAGVAYGPDIVV